MKHIIRKEIIGRLRAQGPEERARKSSLIKGKLFKLEEFKKAKRVMFYVSTDEEVSTKEMISETLKMGKKVCVPITFEEEKRIEAGEIDDSCVLRKGPYGIYQPEGCDIKPVNKEKIDLVVVPGVAFDRCNVRLGRGHGYYDRFLKDLPDSTKTVALAFDFQVVEAVPKDSHDIPVSKIITA